MRKFTTATEKLPTETGKLMSVIKKRQIITAKKLNY
jgi:hypothetical protein